MILCSIGWKVRKVDGFKKAWGTSRMLLGCYDCSILIYRKLRTACFSPPDVRSKREELDVLYLLIGVQTRGKQRKAFKLVKNPT